MSADQPDFFGGTSRRAGRQEWRSIRLPPDLADAIEALAEEREATFSAALKQILVAGLNALGRGARW